MLFIVDVQVNNAAFNYLMTTLLTFDLIYVLFVVLLSY